MAGPRPWCAPCAGIAAGISGTAPSRACEVADDPRLALLGDYVEQIAHQRRLSPTTVVSYEHSIRQLLAINPGIELSKLQSQHIRRAVAQLHAGGMSGRSIARMLRHLLGCARVRIVDGQDFRAMDAQLADVLLRQNRSCGQHGQHVRFLDGLRQQHAGLRLVHGDVAGSRAPGAAWVHRVLAVVLAGWKDRTVPSCQ